VISILPVDSCFRVVAPRWPNFSLKVLPPHRARPRIWWPRQMPNTGTFDATSVFAFSIA
jgi:hypothetical protein